VRCAGTPPEQLLFALRQALDMLFSEGLENVFLRRRLLAEVVRRTVTAWKDGGTIDFNITEPPECCDSVPTVLMADGWDPGVLQSYCNAKCGVALGAGLEK
jgi:alanine-glyoxylate transaminase / serine-glyoxylate transaminase / serine-pyruvate transaminase